jgi:acyl-CoA dehydrogenase
MTRAERAGDRWRIDGRKWYSTGGDHASFLIVMARTGEDDKTGATMFLVDRRAPGVKLLRNIPVMAPDMFDHQEAEFIFDGVEVGDDAVLMGVGEGFRLAQQRLVPARLTHCMRWLGLAERTLTMCREYLLSRKSFGRVLAEHQSMQRYVAENAAAIHAGNLMTFHAAWMMEHGRAKESRAYSSMAKHHVANLLCKVLDDAIQMHGGKGYSDDLPFGRWYLSARAARIADGPDEVHQMLIAREFFMGRLELLV